MTAANAIAGLSSLAQKWHIYTPGELRQRCEVSGRGDPLIADLIPKQSISLVVGDSGIGKSPLLYQAALCVASGMPFLGHQTSQGRVLYLDFENGIGQVNDLIGCLARHLGLSEIPNDLLLWNYNAAPSNWSAGHLPAMVSDAQPALVIIDSLVAFEPEVEENAGNVTRLYQQFRKIARDSHTAISGVHHLKKPSTATKGPPPPPSLEENPHGWFLQARGSRALVNGSDVRIGIDRPRLAGPDSEVALVLGGFSRLSGIIPNNFISRVLGEDGEPVGYERLTGARLLFNDHQEQAYRSLPQTVRFTNAQRIYKRGPQATLDWLNKCISIGIMRRDGREYRKLEVAESAERRAYVRWFESLGAPPSEPISAEPAEHSGHSAVLRQNSGVAKP